jgi:O-antigen/teichoic acid export membrane protein
LLIVAPAAVAAMVLSPVMLRLFGQGYAANGEAVFLLLAASIVLIAPVYLYLALLRSREDRGLLVAYPAVLVAALVVAAPWFEARYGLPGVGMAWVVIHTPLAAFAAQRLRHQIHADAAQEAAPQPTVAPVAAVRPPGEEVTHALGDPADQRGAAHLE